VAALTDDKLALIGLLLPHEHADQGGLARAVGPDDADDAAGGQRESEVLDECAVAEALAHALGLHHLARLGLGLGLGLGLRVG
jgi:hypothetical protein